MLMLSRFLETFQVFDLFYNSLIFMALYNSTHAG